jgi:endoglucanase
MLGLALSAPSVRAQPLPFTGTNLSGGEFGNVSPTKAPVYGHDFIYPNATEFDYFASKGMNVIRLPFHWEVLQPQPKTPLVPAEEQRLKDVVAAATKKGLVILLDPHNYARYYGKVIGGPDVGDDAFADFWGRLAADFRANPRVWFGLMNEPHDMPTPQWFGAANAAVAAIRKAGAKNLILIPGNGWSGAHSWEASGNDILLQIKDPAHHYAFEAHQYLDFDNSGTHPEAVSATVGSERLRAFTVWCRRHHQRAFLGEFGVAASDTGRTAINDMLTYMEKNRDVWIGYTWWSAGPWWGNYMFTIEPDKGVDRPQMSYLLPHLHGAFRTSASASAKTKLR